MLNKLEFACLCHKLVKVLGIQIDSDIIALIYQEYATTFYDKYTLFQLISMMDERNMYICYLNKSKIIQTIVDYNLDIPDKSRYDIPEKTKWSVFNIKYIDHLTYGHTVHVSANIISIDNVCGRIELMVGDVFRINDKSFTINSIVNNSNMTIKYSDTNNQTEISIQDFITMIDNKNTWIMKNQLREKKNASFWMDRKYLCNSIS